MAPLVPTFLDTHALVQPTLFECGLDVVSDF